MIKLLLKRFYALLLAVSFFLPLTQCSQKMGGASSPEVITASSAYEWPGLLSTIALLLFFWPLAIQFWMVIKRLRLPSRKVSWMEVGLSTLSLTGISWLVLSWHLSLGASVRYGAYLAWGGALVYGAISFTEAIKRSSQ